VAEELINSHRSELAVSPRGRARGGPMFYADEQGLNQVLQRVLEFARNLHGDPALDAGPPICRLERRICWLRRSMRH
jgi:hypothetical protein